MQQNLFVVDLRQTCTADPPWASVQKLRINGKKQLNGDEARNPGASDVDGIFTWICL